MRISAIGSYPNYHNLRASKGLQKNVQKNQTNTISFKGKIFHAGEEGFGKGKGHFFLEADDTGVQTLWMKDDEPEVKVLYPGDIGYEKGDGHYETRPLEPVGWLDDGPGYVPVWVIGKRQN